MSIPQHVLEYLQREMPGGDENYYLEFICNNGCVLPEEGITEYCWHMPYSWLGGKLTTLAITDDELAQQARTRMGWRDGVKYMVVVPSPSLSELQMQTALTAEDSGGSFLRKELHDAGIDQLDVGVSYAVRFALPQSLRQYKIGHKRFSAMLLREDIERTKPKVILLCGADCLRALFGEKAKLDSNRGNVLHYVCRDGTEIPVVPTVSHLSFLSGHANISVFRSELRRAKELADGVYVQRHAATHYRTCTTVEQVRQLVADIRESGSKRIAFDTEFGNDVAREEYRYTLSIQLAWAAGHAAFIKLRDHEEQPPVVELQPYGPKRKDGTRKTKEVVVQPPPKYGVRVFSPEDEKTVWKLLQDLFLDTRFQLAGQHLRVDVEEFNRAGFNIDSRIADGFDTMLVHHLLYGDENQGLDHLVRKYRPGFGAYWHDLEEWLDKHERQKTLRFGYRNVPPQLLEPYGLKDADATWQVAESLDEELADQPRLREFYYNNVAPTSLHLLDVERQGLLVDEDARMQLREFYQPVYEKLLAELRERLNWPEFNPAAKQQVAYLLFGDHEYKDRDKVKPTIPETARMLHLYPLYNTDKYPRMWADLEDPSTQTPCVKAAVLDLLSTAHTDLLELKLLKFISVVGKFLSTYLSPITLNEFGVPLDGDGLHNNIRNDGRAVTRLSQLTQTGRYTSSKSNLQTNPKKQEAALFEATVYAKYGISVKAYKKRTFDGDPEKGLPAYSGPDFIPKDDRIEVMKFKECFIAPEDCYLVEADFKNAEVFIAAYCSGDPALIEVVDNGRDVHCETACRCFNLPPLADLNKALEAMKAGDRSLMDAWIEHVKSKYDTERTIAKAVVFGILYGRGAGSLSREISKQTGKDVSQEVCQGIIDRFFGTYTKLQEWLEKNMESAIENEYVENAFGRRRYFQGVSQMGYREQAAARREASNSPIQGCVADLLARAGVLFYEFSRSEMGAQLPFKILLPIHDAFLFEVRKEHVKKFVKLVKCCMGEWNKIPGTDKHLGVDVEVYKRWGGKKIKNY